MTRVSVAGKLILRLGYRKACTVSVVSQPAGAGLPAEGLPVGQEGRRVGGKIQSGSLAEIPDAGLLAVAGRTIAVIVQAVHFVVAVVVDAVGAVFLNARLETEVGGRQCARLRESGACTEKGLAGVLDQGDWCGNGRE